MSVINLKQYKFEKNGDTYIGNFYNRAVERALYWPLTKTLCSHFNGTNKFPFRVYEKPLVLKNPGKLLPEYELPEYVISIPKFMVDSSYTQMAYLNPNNERLLMFCTTFPNLKSPTLTTPSNTIPTLNQLKVWLGEIDESLDLENNSSTENETAKIVRISGYDDFSLTWHLQEAQPITYWKNQYQKVTEHNDIFTTTFNVRKKDRFVAIIQGPSQTTLHETKLCNSKTNIVETGSITVTNKGTDNKLYLVYDSTKWSISKIIDKSNNFDITNQFIFETFVNNGVTYSSFVSKNKDIFSGSFNLQIIFNNLK